jgi:hypothetical protein
MSILIFATNLPEIFLSVRRIEQDTIINVGRVAQSVWRMTTSWTVRGSNSGGGEIFRTRPDRPPSLLYNGYRVFPGGKAAGAWC